MLYMALYVRRIKLVFEGSFAYYNANQIINAIIMI